jgi:D-3-phosphoglycerate dehydrogenase
VKNLKILLCENIHPLAKESLESNGFLVDLISHAPDEAELIEILPNYDAIGIRSKTKMTKNVIEKNSHLLTIGCFCIGTNQVDLEAAKVSAIPVFNAPHSNTRSVAELVIAEAISLARQIADRSMFAHQGKWSKTATGAFEVRGKTIGIVGYGHIGSQVSVLSEALGMKVLFYDVVKKLPLGNATQIGELAQLYANSDFITLHVPELPETKNMIGKKELAQMKAGSFLINASRGSVVVLEDLKDAIESNHLGGCAIDVFPSEPASNNEEFKSPLQGVRNVILTPHIGGSTEEAQVNIGGEVSESLRRFLKAGSSHGSVNFPQVDLPLKGDSSRLLNVHRNEPGVLSAINNIISASGANIEGQYLSTDPDIGYLVVDVKLSEAKNLEEEIKKLPRSIRTRIVS